VRRRLANRVRTVLLPGLGRRAPRGTDLRVERQAERLLNELAVDGADTFVLVGHSASCAVVVEAAAHSDAVVGLVLVGPVTDPRARTWPRMLGQWLRTARHERLHEVPLLAPQYLRAGAMTMMRGMDAMRRYRTDQALARIDLPVVVVRGSEDRIAAQDWARRLSTNARGRLEAVDGAAHMVPLTHPDAVAAAVREIASRSRSVARRGCYRPEP
jgi:pimeloyl-ACP methyl ester carboxylesterase